MYYTYILICADSSYYVGSTDNLQKRLKKHNDGQAADFTAKRLPCTVVWCQQSEGRKKATQKESEIKKFSREKKEKLILAPGTIWQHYKRNKYIILEPIDDMIVYAKLDQWKNYFVERKTKGNQLGIWIRDKDQWLDWIDKNRRILRFNLVY